VVNIFCRSKSFLNGWRFFIWYMFKVRFTSILHELIIFNPYWFVIMLHNNMSFHIFISSFHDHNLSICEKFLLWWWNSWSWTQQSLVVDGLVRIFNWCDCQIGRGNILVEHTSQHSLMNCSMVITLGKGFLNCSLTTLFLYFSWTSCGFGESTNVFSFESKN
jgi:hypothetical protein